MSDKKTEFILYNQLPESIRNEVAVNVGYYSLALLGIRDSGKPTEDIALTASGTLVNIGGNHYVLTAGHVISMLTKRSCDALGFNISASPHAFRIEFGALKTAWVWNETEREVGPDIGLILLPPAKLGEFSARKNFWNMDLKQIEAVEREYSDDFLWAVCGAPFEKTSTTKHIRKYKEVLHQHMGPWLANKVVRYEKGGFDFIDVIFQGKPDPDWPTDFRGLSGGGLWHVILRRNPEDKSIELYYLLFSGTAFYQDNTNPEYSLIRCHGEMSTYLKIQDLVAQITK